MEKRIQKFFHKKIVILPRIFYSKYVKYYQKASNSLFQNKRLSVKEQFNILRDNSQLTQC